MSYYQNSRPQVEATPLNATQKKLLKDVRLQCLKSDHFYNEVLRMVSPSGKEFVNEMSNPNNLQQ